MSEIFGTVEGGAVGAAVGIGAAAAIEPVVEPAKQEVWHGNPYRVLGPELLARLVAKALVEFDPARDQAQRSGIDQNKFRAMVEDQLLTPGVPEALELWRRHRISRAQMTHVLSKAQVEPQYHDAIMELVGERLTPADVANAVQQGFLDDAGLLPQDPGGARPYTPPVEQVSLTDAEDRPVTTLEEASASGMSEARMKVLAELAGLPPGAETLLEMWRRNIITETAVAHGIREGHTKTKWTSAIKALKMHLLPAGVLVRLRLKGWIEEPEYLNRMETHGYTHAAAKDWYLAEGRPAAPGQMATAVARGVDGPDKRPMDREQFIKGIRESDIRPEWGPLLWDIRFTYPPLFQINRLVQAGAIDADTARDWAHKDRYAPEVVRALHAYWTEATTVSEDTHIGKAETQLWTRTHTSYIATEIDDARARSMLAALGVTGNPQNRVIALWDRERDLIRRQLTPADIRKAFRKAARNYATGQPWTRDDAIDALVARGYSVTEANDYLDIPVK